jgi:hypothetical protein
MQSHMTQYCDTIIDNLGYMQSNQNELDSDIISLMHGRNLRIYEVDSLGSVTLTNTTFDIGMN